MVQDSWKQPLEEATARFRNAADSAERSVLALFASSRSLFEAYAGRRVNETTGAWKVVTRCRQVQHESEGSG